MTYAPPAAALIAILSGAAGIALLNDRRARLLVPLSGGLLVAVAVFGLLPEVTRSAGWLPTLVLAASGFAFLALLEHRGYDVCPSCSHGGRFAGSLVVATAFHAFVDGWGIGVTREVTLGNAIAAAILLHKVPEGLALGAMLRTSTQGLGKAVALLLIAELPTVAGGLAALRSQPGIWLSYPLAIACGIFIFLGTHAFTGWLRTSAARK